MFRMYETLYQNKIRIIYERETQNDVILLVANGIFRKNYVYYLHQG